MIVIKAAPYIVTVTRWEILPGRAKDRLVGLAHAIRETDRMAPANINNASQLIHGATASANRVSIRIFPEEIAAAVE